MLCASEIRRQTQTSGYLKIEVVLDRRKSTVTALVVQASDVRHWLDGIGGFRARRRVIRRGPDVVIQTLVASEGA